MLRRSFLASGATALALPSVVRAASATTLKCQDAATNATFTGSDDAWGNGSATNKETGCVDAFYAAQQMKAHPQKNAKRLRQQHRVAPTKPPDTLHGLHVRLS